jgi:uncharacterized membrane protein YoaK (UPF0700 family)
MSPEQCPRCPTSPAERSALALRPVATPPAHATPRLPRAVPSLLLVLTFVTGIVDAVSYLGLGRTFVANMTGNIVFLGFGLAGAKGLSVAAALVSLGAFLGGALIGGRVTRRLGEPRHRWLLPALAFEIVFIAVAAVVATGLDPSGTNDVRYAVIALLAVPMGMRNATVRAIGVPDLTTTVLTMTITGLAADSPLAGGSGTMASRKLLAIGAMLVGALAGGLLVIHGHLQLALWATVALLGASLAAYHVALQKDRSDG